MNKIDLANEIIAKMLELSSNPYLALSFGKDSLVMLDLVLKQFPDIQCNFLKSDESDLMHDFKGIEEWYLTNKSLNLNIVNTHRMQEVGWDYALAQKGKKDDWFLDGFIHDKFGNKFDGVFMGLRIEESKARRMTLLKKSNNVEYKFIHKYKTGKRKDTYRCCPIAHFSESEIMEYLKENKLKYLEIYRFGSHIRTSARLPRKSTLAESSFWLQKNDPERYRQLKCKVKGI